MGTIASAAPPVLSGSIKDSKDINNRKPKEESEMKCKFVRLVKGGTRKMCRHCGKVIVEMPRRK